MSRVAAPSPVDRTGSMRIPVGSFASWPIRRWIVASLATGATALITGIPTGMITTSFYTRMTPVTWWDYPFWVLSALLVGLIAATYFPTGQETVSPTADPAKRTLGGTLLAVFAIGCPICNKLVVAVLGVSGALTYFGPVQPLLGFVSVGLLATALVLRLRGAVACPLRTT